jgi:hypothetical protein
MLVGTPRGGLDIKVSVYFLELVAGTYILWKRGSIGKTTHELLEKYILRRKEWWEDREKEREEEIRFLESLLMVGTIHSNAPEAVGELTP